MKENTKCHLDIQKECTQMLRLSTFVTKKRHFFSKKKKKLKKNVNFLLFKNPGRSTFSIVLVDCFASSISIFVYAMLNKSLF